MRVWTRSRDERRARPIVSRWGILEDVGPRGTRRGLRAIGAVALAVTACSGDGNEVIRADGPPGNRQAEIVLAELQGTRTLLISVDACDADHNQVSVDETAQAVTVTVVTDDPPGGTDCADGVRVELDAPLAARDLIDGSTGEVVEVGEI
jgi:hypothetical protein